MEDYILSCCSSCDLSNEWIEKRNLHYVCFNVMVGNEQKKDDMGKSFSPWEMYERMAAGEDTKTSMVSIGEYMDYFRPFLEDGKDIIHVTLSTGISGTYNSACQAADTLAEEFPHRQITIIDSLAASSGYGLLMDLAADKRDEGMSYDNLVQWIENYKLNIIHWFFSTDLTYYIKGGRISKAAGMVGQMLNICPLLDVDYQGHLTPREKVRTKKKVIRRIVEKMVETADYGIDYFGKVFISDSDKELGLEVIHEVERAYPRLKGKIQRFDIGCTIGAHTGPGTVALFYQGQKRYN